MIKPRFFTKKLNKHTRFLMFLWGLVLVSVISCFMALMSLQEHLDARYHKQANDLELLKLLHQTSQDFYQQADNLDYFSLTLKSNYLRNYLKALNAMDPVSLVSSAGSYLSSDFLQMVNQLTQHQLHVLKLILQGHHVPDEVIPEPIAHYRLSQAEINLTAKEKLDLAETVLLTHEAVTLHQDIHALLAQALYDVEEVLLRSHHDNEHVAKVYYDMMTGALVLLIVLLLVIVWIKIAEIDQSEDVHAKETETLLPSFGDKS